MSFVASQTNNNWYMYTAHLIFFWKYLQTMQIICVYNQSFKEAGVKEGVIVISTLNVKIWFVKLLNLRIFLYLFMYRALLLKKINTVHKMTPSIHPSFGCWHLTVSLIRYSLIRVIKIEKKNHKCFFTPLEFILKLSKIIRFSLNHNKVEY